MDDKFSFVNHSFLKYKLDTTLKYLIYLWWLEKQNLEDEIIFSINRDIIIHITSIIEWLLAYLIFEISISDNNKFKSILEKNLKIKELKKVSILKDLQVNYKNLSVVFCEEKEKVIKINWKLNFDKSIKIISEMDIFDEKLIIFFKEIQKIRNNIHIQNALDKKINDENLTDENLLRIYEYTRIFRLSIEDFLKTLSSKK